MNRAAPMIDPHRAHWAPVLTAIEAATYLRLTEGRGEQNAIRALNHLVDDRGLITPLRYTKARMYARIELDRFIRDQMGAGC